MNKQEHLLATFAEELGELSVELLVFQKHVSKALRFGIDEQRDLPTSNRERIQAEWQDLLGSLEKLKTVGVNLYPDTEAIQTKMSKIDWHCSYARSLGVLEDGSDNC